MILILILILILLIILILILILILLILTTHHSLLTPTLTTYSHTTLHLLVILPEAIKEIVEVVVSVI